MDTKDKPENASETQDLGNSTASSSTNVASNTPNVSTPPSTEPSNVPSLAKEFTNGVIKVLSNPEVSREGTFEEDVDKACR